ncbi:MAG TPA: NAD(P)/FAD-dependent oxidoreductase [Candidatus Binatia bacterium]|jgi:flavin-dependent dehydrogenase|nr:NAD(P)/FAD-dependent oxidoreductase [Candidatus Binatia bacterium]
MSQRPEAAQILVAGGGPAGATAAAMLAREGFRVVLVERDRFPRYHIGESLLPSALDFLDLLGAREKIEQHGFQRKAGAHIEWGSQQWDLFFGELSGKNTYSFQVVRSEFDQCLMDHARQQGATVLQGVELRDLRFEGERPVAAILAPTGMANDSWEIDFDYLVDASGRNGLLSTRYLRNRYYHEIFKNVAIWGYWKNTNRFDGKKDGAIATISIPYGWIWAIPLHDGSMSVGVVLHKETFKERRAQLGIEQLYHRAIAESATVSWLLETGELTTELHAETDYSYACDRFAGPAYYIAGDAACFLDPLLSTGVHLAMMSGLLSSASIASVMRGEVSEQEATSFYDRCYRRAYLRYLVFLSAFYNQYDGKESIFWMAQELTGQDAAEANLKKAFTNLMSGVEDWKDVRESAGTHSYLLREMSTRVKENLAFRKDKTMIARHDASGAKLRENGQFFDKVEGISILTPEDAVDGLYVVAEPRLGLARILKPEPVTG